MPDHDKFIVLIDGHHLQALQRQLNFRVDFKRLLAAMRQRGQLVRIYYFNTVDDREEQQSIIRLLDWLQYNGFHVVRVSPSDSFELEVGVLAFGFLQEESISEMVFVAGSRQFCSLIELVKRRGIRTIAISTTATSPHLIHDRLRRAVDEVVEMDDLVEDIRVLPADGGSNGK